MNEQPDTQSRIVRRDANVETVAAVRKAIKQAWLVDGDKTDVDADRLALAAIAALAQSDVEPVRTAPETCPHCFNEEDCGQIELCSALAKGRQSDAEPIITEATRYAEQLAVSLGARWYPEVTQWKPMSGDLIGLLTQIDNMTTGAVRAQSDAEPKGIDLDDADRAYDKWAEHRNGHSRLDAFRAGVEFGLRHTAPPRPDASGLIEVVDLFDTLRIRHLLDEWFAGPNPTDVDALANVLRLRLARAADRSGK